MPYFGFSHLSSLEHLGWCWPELIEDETQRNHQYVMYHKIFCIFYTFYMLRYWMCVFYLFCLNFFMCLCVQARDCCRMLLSIILQVCFETSCLIKTGIWQCARLHGQQTLGIPSPSLGYRCTFLEFYIYTRCRCLKLVSQSYMASTNWAIFWAFWFNTSIW